jgi:sulfate transport system permease protein
MASYRLTFGASLIAAFINVVFGGIVAWVLVRYKFPGKRIVDAGGPAVLPTAVAGITLTALYSPNGWIGQFIEGAGHQGGVHAAGRGDGADLHRPAVRGAHRAAGAGRRSANWKKPPPAWAPTWQTFTRVIFPTICRRC